MIILLYPGVGSQDENFGSMQGELVFLRPASCGTIVIKANIRSIGLSKVIEPFDDVCLRSITNLKTYQSHNVIKKIFAVYARSEIDHGIGLSLTTYQQVS